MSRLNATYEDALAQWVNAATGIPAMWDYPDAPKTGRGPKRKEIKLPYATIGYTIGSQAVGRGYDLSYKEATTYTYKFYKSMVVSVNIYAKANHLALAQSLVNSIQLPGKNAVLRIAGLSHWGNSDPLDISEILETKSQLRAVIDFTFGYRVDEEDNSGIVDVINISGEVDDITTETTVKEEAPSMEFDDEGNSQYLGII